jgi:phosphoribosylaminoimidazole-succinocarboxamide synthase
MIESDLGMLIPKNIMSSFAVVDTKFEFGKDENGNILLIDEVLTPDSSRFWASATYEERMAAGQEPENFDKEFLRRKSTHGMPFCSRNSGASFFLNMFVPSTNASLVLF